ncbi:unnamed protein product [Rotaria sordida]|uniref:Uncharacterized protein n=1 Tax=Rotaria sordida TaxID=392033 RepID=A0A814JN63_9BILA|nr:unnamed protein product [Rotaria sordida]CAF1189267.1 unnamed protein product [Rotaria sordida]
MYLNQANVDQPWNFTKNCPCINLTRIGDGNIDCYCQQDERNTQQCQNGILIMGYNFLCPTLRRCIFYDSLCKEMNTCRHGEDDNLCYHKRRPTNRTCSGQNGYLCGKHFECPEYRPLEALQVLSIRTYRDKSFDGHRSPRSAPQSVTFG